MPITDVQYFTLALAEVGDVDPQTGDPPDPPEEGVLAANNYIPLLWAQHQDKASQGGTSLQFLYVKRDAMHICLAIVGELVSFSEGLSGESLQMGQKFDHRKARLDALVQEITQREEWLARQITSYNVGYLVASEPALGPGTTRRTALPPCITGSPYVSLPGTDWRRR